MKTIDVHTAHKISHADGSQTLLTAGVHTVEDDLADHWYVKINSRPIPVVVEQVAVAPAAAENPKSAKATK